MEFSIRPQLNVIQEDSAYSAVLSKFAFASFLSNTLMWFLKDLTTVSFKSKPSAIFSQIQTAVVNILTVQSWSKWGHLNNKSEHLKASPNKTFLYFIPTTVWFQYTCWERNRLPRDVTFWRQDTNIVCRVRAINMWKSQGSRCWWGIQEEW